MEELKARCNVPVYNSSLLIFKMLLEILRIISTILCIEKLRYRDVIFTNSTQSHIS